MHPEPLREHIRKCKAATEKPFGVNVPLMYPQIEELMQILVEEQVQIVFTSAGNPKTWTRFLKDHGMKVVHVVSSSKFALKCEEAGGDAIVAEGCRRAHRTGGANYPLPDSGCPSGYVFAPDCSWRNRYR